MTQFRKKPVVIDAWQWKPGDLEAAGVVVGTLLAAGVDFSHPSGTGDTTTLEIKTLEGNMLAQPGDWIICGVQGEFYPCKPDIFETTYEAASADSLPVPSMEVQWAVAYGGDDPNECAGVLEYDDQADAQEHLQWVVGGFLATRTLTVWPWQRAEVTP